MKGGRRAKRDERIKRDKRDINNRQVLGPIQPMHQVEKVPSSSFTSGLPLAIIICEVSQKNYSLITMSCVHIQTENRVHPVRQPPGWKVKYPRWMLQLPPHVDELCITYVGIQPRHEKTPAKGVFTNLHHHITTESQRPAGTKVEEWFLRDSGQFAPELWEKFYVETGYDVPDTEVWVLYWSDGTAPLRGLDLQHISRSLSPEPVVGLWRESFRVPISRFETIYSGNDYRPGIASLEGSSQIPHAFTGYWGAARDRLPASSHEDFVPDTSAPVPNFEKDTKNQTLKGQNQDVLVHIRSGQWWERCPEAERKAYESNLEPVLRRGMAYLEDNASDSGDFGLRFMRNLVSNRHSKAEERAKEDGSEARPRLETCSAGFFRSLKDLESWASSHQTHSKIFHGAHAHSTKFGKETFKLRTWHEVSILKPGEVSFEYVNCEPRTGLIPFVDM